MNKALFDFDLITKPKVCFVSSVDYYYYYYTVGATRNKNHINNNNNCVNY